MDQLMLLFLVYALKCVLAFKKSFLCFYLIKILSNLLMTINRAVKKLPTWAWPSGLPMSGCTNRSCHFTRLVIAPIPHLKQKKLKQTPLHGNVQMKNSWYWNKVGPTKIPVLYCNYSVIFVPIRKVCKTEVFIKKNECFMRLVCVSEKQRENLLNLFPVWSSHLCM